jgi:crotonobetainyl-CoA:carnitine CoA-transferase CaiB-like acyl-CoA transferase
MSTGTPDVPSKAGMSIADIATGMYAYSGILAALYDRERTGRGISLQMAMLDALGELRTQPAYFSRYDGELPRRSGRGIPPPLRTARSRPPTVPSSSVSRTTGNGSLSAATSCGGRTWPRMIASRPIPTG